MSGIPKPDNKPKYNNSAPYEWVDSQWEKFMVEQKEHKAIIKQLQEDLVTCNKHFQIQRENLLKLVSQIPSKFLTNYIDKETYIYESPDGGETIYRRKVNDYDNTEKVDKDGNPLPEQLNLF
tara:strand:+ start:112 stop:477 length:366 start_codon:yes stop_codon:yes gene_type:complete